MKKYMLSHRVQRFQRRGNKKIMGDKCTLRMHEQFLYIGVKVIDKSGKVHQIRCKICISMEGKHKFLYPKLDSLQKTSKKV